MVKILQKLDEIVLLLQQNKQIWTLKEFCRFADLSIDYAYQLTSTGKLKFYRPFGKRIFVDRDEAIKALKQNPVSSNEVVDQISSIDLLKKSNSSKQFLKQKIIKE